MSQKNRHFNLENSLRAQFQALKQAMRANDASTAQVIY